MKTVFLTGGNGDIGRAIATRFQHADYQVIAPRSSELDLQTLDQIENYIKTQPELDVFIHCAGFNEPKPVIETEYPILEKTLRINALSFYQIVRACLRHNKLKSNGHLLGISSLYGIISRKKRLAYTAAKHCLNGMIKTLALELGQQNIKVNGLAPGFVDTQMTRKNNDSATIAGFARKIPLGRLAKPEEIAEIAHFLCSPTNNYINGQIIVADGGYCIGGFQE